MTVVALACVVALGLLLAWRARPRRADHMSAAWRRAERRMAERRMAGVIDDQN